ncbi:MAG: hypothetical protein M9884_04655 [Rhodocyclaceae bacterium]|jgi:hypothetical protein|nr:hypothetical protein [Rhodocyclaceae bacterium]MCO5096747.1 hypothetical protein [Rhodocyclaceae bacterium]
MKKSLFLVMAAALGLGLSACGDRDRVVIYKQGKYQGKPDTQPWNNAPFGGDKAKWEGELKARNQQQDESRRIGG